jgi:two-component system LytT family response regulator
MNPLRLLIVDDEPLVRRGIRHALSAAEQIEVIGECASGAEAVEAVLSHRPDLVLLDVQLQDSTGLDVIRQIGPERMPPVVFLTAYDEYAVAAFELNAVDYVLKPFDEARLRQSIQRARDRIAFRDEHSMGEKLQSLIELQSEKWPERLVVKNGERFDIVPVDSIDWIESANNYVQLHCGQTQYTLSETLTRLEHRLDPAKFLRIHRGRIVNIGRLATVHTMLGGTYQIELQNGTRISSGRQYKHTIQAIIKNQRAE